MPVGAGDLSWAVWDPLDPRIYNEAYLHTQPPNPRLDGEEVLLPCPAPISAPVDFLLPTWTASHPINMQVESVPLSSEPSQLTQRGARGVSPPVSPCPRPPRPSPRGSHAPLRAFDGAVSPVITQLPPSFRPVPKAGPQPPGLPSPAPPQEGRNHLFCSSESRSGICRMHR